MARKPKTIVMDSWAIMAYLEDEPAGERIADMIADARDNNIPLMMTVVNFGEVWYVIARRTCEGDADRTIRELKQLGIQLVEAGWDLTRQAAYYKSRHRMSYDDCFAAALARREKAQLVTGDKEFTAVEPEVSIVWV
jgi:ribonuclease VapC